MIRGATAGTVAARRMQTQSVFTGGSGDPDFASVVSLMHFDDVGSPQAITDVKGAVWTLNANAQCKSDQSKFGGLSLALDGSGDYISTPDTAAWSLGTNNFTFEMFCRWSSLTGQQFIATQFTAGIGDLAFRIYKDASHHIGAQCGNGTTTVDPVSTGTVAADTWYHIAFVRNGNNFSVYIGGTQDGSVNSAFTVLNSNALPVIGRNGGQNGNYFAGWIDEFRFTNGVARYTGNFTPPSAAFPDS